MGTAPSPINVASVESTKPAPFVATTTPTIERANRLMSLRSNPGFIDLLNLSLELVREADSTAIEFEGWDPLQISILKTRAQVARSHHRALLNKIADAIQAGLDEARAQMETAKESASQAAVKSAEDVIEQGDYVRQQVLQNFGRRDEMRAAGSYDTPTTENL